MTYYPQVIVHNYLISWLLSKKKQHLLKIDLKFRKMTFSIFDELCPLTTFFLMIQIETTKYISFEIISTLEKLHYNLVLSIACKEILRH